MVESSIRYSGMVRVAKQLIDSIDSECIACHDFRHEQIPLVEVGGIAEPLRPLLCSDRESSRSDPVLVQASFL